MKNFFELYYLTTIFLRVNYTLYNYIKQVPIIGTYCFKKKELEFIHWVIFITISS
jgi:hypothetical protein